MTDSSSTTTTSNSTESGVGGVGGNDTGRKLRVKERRLYTESMMNEEEEIEFTRLFSVVEKLTSTRFADIYLIKEVKGDEVTIKSFQENGFSTPLLVKGSQLTALAMKVPNSSFSVDDVRQGVGGRRRLDVMDVTTQIDTEMSMKEWCRYWDEIPRSKILNVISLEFSHTKLDPIVESPAIVRSLDWVDWVWPKHLKESHTESTNAIEDMKYPKVQKYVLMSVKGCYTDFHIDFGGTSVWYHIISGRRIFWLIPPSEKNIQLFEQWVLSGKQADIFFGDLVDQCSRVELEAGDTFFIPSGYIHAVYTPEDSIVFGGNFLHSYAIEKQLRVVQVEDTTKVPSKFRYPFYTEMLWYLLERYVHCLTGKTHLSCREDGSPIPTADSTTNDSPFKSQGTQSSQSQPKKPHVHLTSFEVTGLKAVIMWLSRLPTNKRSVPDLIPNSDALLNDAKILIDEHANDDHNLACTGRLPLSWKVRPKNAPLPTAAPTGLSLTAQLRQLKPAHGFLTTKTQSTLKSTNGDIIVPRPRPEPIGLQSTPLSQCLVKPSTILNEMPSSFNDLIAATNSTNTSTPTTTFSNNSQTSTSLTASTTVSSTNTTTTTLTSVTSALPSHTFSSESTNVSTTPSSVIKSPTLVPFTPNTSIPTISSTPAATPQPSLMQLLQSSTVPATSIPPPTLMAPSNKSTPPKSSSNDSARRRRTRCKKCVACLRSDCGDCHFCKDMKKFGGPGRMKQSCIARQCMSPVLPHTACCHICGRDGWEKLSVPGLIGLDDTQTSSLMECSQCWEIVHPMCLKEKNPNLNLELGKRDDLPNSWECPKCVAALKSVTEKQQQIPSQPESSLKIPYLPPLLSKIECTAVAGIPPGAPNVTMDTVITHKIVESSATFTPQMEQPKAITSSALLAIDSLTNSLLFVKSCSRFDSSNGTVSEIPSSPPKSEASTMTTPSPPSTTPPSPSSKKRLTESLKDRLFRSLKKFKKNSDIKSPTTVLPTTTSKLLSPSTPPTMILPKPFSTITPTPTKNSTDGNNASTPSIPTIGQEVKEEPQPVEDKEMKSSSSSEDEEEEEASGEGTSSSDEEAEEQSETITHTSEPPKGDLPQLINGRPIIKPLYVVRPAPISYDVEESDDDDDNSEEDEKENSSDDSSEDEDSDREERLECRRIIRRHFRRFRRPRPDNLAIERDVIFPILRFLDRRDLLNCSLVCKSWNSWTTDPSFWPSLSFISKSIHHANLIGIVKRQPRSLDLSWSNISSKQIQWLLPRLPQLQTLKLQGCTASVVSALQTSNCPLLKSLDISFVDGIDDDLIIEELTASPPDQRPGLLDTRTRLRQLQEISLAGADMTDMGFRVLMANFPNLSRIDISDCSRLTDMAVAYFTNSPNKTNRVTSVRLYGCEGLTDHSIESLKRCPNLVFLDMRRCDRVTIPTFAKLFHQQSSKHPNLVLVANKFFRPKSQ